MKDWIEIMQLHESEARRVRARHAGDRLVRAFVALDLAIRRVAHAILVPDRPRATEAAARAERRASCRS